MGRGGDDVIPIRPAAGGLGKQISYSPCSGADKRSSYAIRPAAGRIRDIIL